MNYRRLLEHQEKEDKKEVIRLNQERDDLFNEIDELIKDFPQKKKDDFYTKLLHLIGIEIDLEKYCNQ